MNKQITLDKEKLGAIMPGSAIALMKDSNEATKKAVYDEQLPKYIDAAQSIIDEHGEEEAPKIFTGEL